MLDVKIAGQTMGTPHYPLSEAMELFSQLQLERAEVIYQDGYMLGFPQVKEDSMPSRSYGYQWYPMELPPPEIGIARSLEGLNRALRGVPL